MMSAPPGWTVYAVAAAVILPLIAASALTEAQLSMPVRNAVLCLWSVGAVFACERVLFGRVATQAVRSMGFVRARSSIVMIASAVSIPMWLSLPVQAWLTGSQVALKPDWMWLLAGVIVLNGVSEEVIHRSFVFGHLRVRRSFVRAASFSAIVFAAQHLYLVGTIGWVPGLSSVALAALLSYPLAFVFERGGRSIVGPAILHTSSNAAPNILTTPEGFAAGSLLAHMTVVLISIYLVFLAWLDEPNAKSAPRP